MYNKSEIMKTAWRKFRTGQYGSFAGALETAWNIAKKEAELIRQGYVKTSELKVGDTVAIEYGDFNNNLECVITSIPEKLHWGKHIIQANRMDGTSGIEFCSDPSKYTKRVAQGVKKCLVA